MLVQRRSFQRQLLVGCLVWSLLGSRRASAFRGFGIGGAIDAVAAAAAQGAVTAIIEGLRAVVLFIPLLLVEALLDAFANRLGLDDGQRDQLKRSREDLLKDLLDAGGTIMKRPEAERGLGMYDEFLRLAPKYRGRIYDILKPQQRQRLVQVERQFEGVHAMLSGEVSQALALTDEQHEQLTAIADELGEKIQALRSGKDKLTPLVLGRLLVMRKFADLKAHRVLTPEQHSKWRELVGEPILIGEFLPWDKLLAVLNEKDETPVEKN